MFMYGQFFHVCFNLWFYILTLDRGQFFNKFFIFDCQKRFRLPKSILWQSKMSNLRSAIAISTIENSLFGNRE